jgi:hypothetical protein
VISIDQIILGFNAHIPIWGGQFTFQKKKLNVTNTCTIDNYLFAFWVLKKIIPYFEKRLPQQSIQSINEQSIQLKEIISNIKNKNWYGARQIWYTKIMNLIYQMEEKLI